MENKEAKETFNYTYSAKQQEEIKRIRDKYVEQEEDKMEYLRKLDASVSQKAVIVSLVVGIIGTLLLGVGMSCTMVWKEGLFIPGVVIGVIGIAILSLAYPLYNKTLKKERERIAPEILRLTEELMK